MTETTNEQSSGATGRVRRLCADDFRLARSVGRWEVIPWGTCPWNTETQTAIAKIQEAFDAEIRAEAEVRLARLAQKVLEEVSDAGPGLSTATGG
jgi:hypothetical protein